MLDKMSERLLKIAIDVYDDKPVNLAASSIGITHNELAILCKYLYDEGYLLTYHVPYRDEDNFELHLSHAGLKYFEYKRIERIEYYKKLALSKTSDIIVSAIVALIVSLLVA